MCVPDRKKVHPFCHHEWYDWVLCAHQGNDDLGHQTPCHAAASGPAPVPVEDGIFCPVCFVGSARCGWICSIWAAVNHCGPWRAVNCAWCGDDARLGHVACHLCVRILPEHAETYHAGGGPRVVKPSPRPPRGGDVDDASPGPAAAAAEDDDDVDMDEELEPIDNVEEVLAGIFHDDEMIHAARGDSDLLGPAPRPVEEMDGREEIDFAPGVFFRRPSDESGRS